LRLRGPLHEAQVAGLRQHEIYLDAAHGGHVQGRDQRLVGQKIRRHDAHRSLRRRQRSVDSPADGLEVLVGSIGNAAGYGLSPARDLRIPNLPLESLLGGEAPVGGERVHDFPDHRSLHPKVEVLDRMRRVAPQQATLTDIHAAGEGEAAIDHHDLPVVAQVHVGIAQRDRRVQELGHRDAASGQQLGDLRAAVPGPDRIDQHPHLDAAAHCITERIEKHQPRTIVVEDIAAHGDAVPRPGDGFEHGGIGLVAVHQWLDEVSRGKRHAGGPANELPEAEQMRLGALDKRRLIGLRKARAIGCCQLR